MLIGDSGCLGLFVNFNEIKKIDGDVDYCSLAHIVEVQYGKRGYRVDRSIISMRLNVPKEEM